MMRSPAEEQLVRQNRRLRAQVLREVATLSATQVDGLAVRVNASRAPGVAEGWLQDRRVFALKVKASAVRPNAQSFSPASVVCGLTELAQQLQGVDGDRTIGQNLNGFGGFCP